MFQNQDFWIGLGVGVLAGIFGYKLMVEREQQLLALQQPAAAAASATVPVAELQRQKEELEDMIAAQEQHRLNNQMKKTVSPSWDSLFSCKI